MKGKRDWKNKQKFFCLICILCTIFGVVEVLLVQLAYYHNSVNSDLAGHLLSACVGLKEHTPIPHGYNHTSVLGFESHAWFMPPFLALFKTIKKAMIASNLLMLFFFFLSSYTLLRSFKVKRSISYLYSLFLMLPFNVIMVDMHVLSQYYLIQLIGICITISLFNYITEVNTIKKCVIMCLGGGYFPFGNIKWITLCRINNSAACFIGGVLIIRNVQGKVPGAYC